MEIFLNFFIASESEDLDETFEYIRIQTDTATTVEPEQISSIANTRPNQIKFEKKGYLDSSSESGSQGYRPKGQSLNRKK